MKAFTVERRSNARNKCRRGCRRLGSGEEKWLFCAARRRKAAGSVGGVSPPARRDQEPIASLHTQNAARNGSAVARCPPPDAAS